MIQPDYNGIVEDPRTDDEKAKDYIHDELFMAPPAPVWEEREPRKFPIVDQDGSGSCVACGTAKVLGIDEVYEGRQFADLSRRDIYVRRANKTTAGMYLPNALEIATKHGATHEALVPSERRNEAEMNVWDDITADTDKLALTYRAKGYVQLPLDIDAIASITSQGKGVLLGARFDYNEWTDFPNVNPNSTRQCGHAIAIVDNILIKGKKYLVIDDSWGPGNAKYGQRFISEEFLKARCFYAGYTLNLTLEPQPEPTKPKHTFKVWMKRGDKNAEVVALQDVLKYEGLFPANVDSTGLYGPVTQSAVKKFQDKYLGYNNAGKQVGPATLAKLNELYS